MDLGLAAFAEDVLASAEQSPAQHHRYLMERLEAVGTGEMDRLMVLMPPGSAKSTYVSILFPAWYLARHPRAALMTCCHTDSLASHFGRRTRALVQEQTEILGYGIAGDERAAHRWRTSRGGEYFATGLRGPIAGRRADLVIIDDPVKSWAEADSPLAREHAWNWYRSDLLPRLKPRGRIILVMTRWHQDDLGGRIQEMEAGWTVVKLPALAVPPDPLGREPGAALWPDWEDAAALLRKKTAMGERAFAALFQQDPRPPAGGLFLTERVGLTDIGQFQSLAAVRAWDLAAAVPAPGRDPDWTIGLRLERDQQDGFIVQDIRRLRGTPGEVEAAILSAAQQDGAAVLIALPQDPGQAGLAQIAYLTSKLAGYIVKSSPETGSKLTRASPVAAQVEAGNVRLIQAPWNRPFLEELRDFPHGAKDDQVDALSRAFMTLVAPAKPARRLQVSLLAR
ncbi:phage terminase large subunit [Acidisoma cellulosilytica]|uniref:Phage terminase large subunit n=1 Tax=Acidisoma cellulosilyticum TaxID=2802395 RepID=A0A963Z050_9PROT|nr:phage terminase large subunit [Acidisoma cellulosilyticum]MCB8880402.1 phage terminase large subunit [Acidisoma cellulosilyticum]